MRLRSLRVDGFGRLADRTFAFAPGLNVVVGPNEAGKSTLAAAIVAALYGLQRGEKDRWRPWTGTAYATALTYETSDGATWEVHRAYERDTKGVRVFDADGADAAARLGKGKTLNPGEAHLGISLDVFLQTACARQRAVALDAACATDVSTALAHALGGGPKEDAAAGALARLDDAQRRFVGTDRAHKNIPLRKLRDLEAQQSQAANDARAALDRLSSLREQIAGARGKRDRDAAAAVEVERRARALRAAHVRARLDALKEYRAEFAALQTARAAFDDVAPFTAERVSALEDAYLSWRSSESVAEAAARDVAEEALTETERRELDERRRDAGTLDDDAFMALRAAAAQAEAAHARSAAAANDAATARRDDHGGGTATTALTLAALIGTAADAGVAIAHLWAWTAVLGVVAAVLALAASRRARSREARRREADAKQRIADAALADEQLAAGAVARVLAPLGIASVGELARRRERFIALTAREQSARKAESRARTARGAALSEAGRFDDLADALIPDVHGDRDVRRKTVRESAARRRERDGLDARLAMLAMQRDNILRGDDEFGLHAELDALVASGAEPAAEDDPQTLRMLERQRADLDARAREAERLVASLEGELRAGEESVAEVAVLDEALSQTRAEIARLEAFDRAVKLARAAIDARKEEAHRAFARRLEEYGAGVLGALTAGRYGEIRVDPATLAIRARVPETGAIEELETLSAGTRDQIALVVRFATARMFSEGFETPPVLLDDPFAFWDAARIARCLPVLVQGALDAQCILFTTSPELAIAAARAGATRIELSAIPAVIEA
ncbi:MAG TPA: AAA family ATPase [Candidatus Elarobacter sp.]